MVLKEVRRGFESQKHLSVKTHFWGHDPTFNYTGKLVRKSKVVTFVYELVA